MITAEVLRHFDHVKPAGPGKWMARCPAHEDETPSLAISEAADNVLLKCFAGCETTEIVNRVGLSMRDLFTDGTSLGRQPVVTYDYVDESGAILYQVVRYEPKGFSQRRPDGKGGWISHLDCEKSAKCKCNPKLPPVRPVIYNLPKVTEAAGLVIVEGEKDVGTAGKLGLVATCNSGGAGKWRPEYATYLRGKRVVVIADADSPGVGHAREVARSLVPVAQWVKLIEALPQAKDVTEWVEKGGTKEQLLNLIREAPKLTPADLEKWGQQKEPRPAEPGHPAKLICFSEIQPKQLRWVWLNRIPAGKLSLIVGDPDKGKSLITLDMAARISTGRPFPDGAPCERGSAIILSAEDDAEDTIRPRLEAAEADLSRVHWFEAVRVPQRDGKQSERTFSLESDINTLHDAIKQHPDVRVIFIDPISAYLGGTESQKNAEVRGLLGPLKGFTASTGVTVVGVTHFRKSSGPAIHRSIDSIAFAAAARAVWGVAADPEDTEKRIMLRIKGNLSLDPGGLAYRIKVDSGLPRIAWEPGAVNLQADDVMGGLESREDTSERQEAAQWLREFLADGPKPVREVQKQADKAGFSWATVRRAKATMGLCKKQTGFHGGWQWSLSEADEPTDAQESPHTDAQPQSAYVSNCGDTRTNKGVDVSTPSTDAQPAQPEQLSISGGNDSTFPPTEPTAEEEEVTL